MRGRAGPGEQTGDLAVLSCLLSLTANPDAGPVPARPTGGAGTQRVGAQ